MLAGAESLVFSAERGQFVVGLIYRLRRAFSDRFADTFGLKSHCSRPCSVSNTERELTLYGVYAIFHARFDLFMPYMLPELQRPQPPFK